LHRWSSRWVLRRYLLTLFCTTVTVQSCKGFRPFIISDFNAIVWTFYGLF
jgi:hypothetical protein